ncbi:MAG: hypothetical protein ABEJ44_00440 [Halanaeroarchaeum sp.]
MAVDAARRALEESSVGRDDLSAVTLGTTTPPLEENDLAAQLVEMLGLPRTVRTTVSTQSTRAGTAALRIAMDARDGPAMAIATDCPVGNPDDSQGHGAGAGAIAMVLTDDGSATIRDAGSYAREFPGTRYRERGETTVKHYDATAYERQAYAATIAGALEDLDPTATALAPTAPDGALPYRAANETDRSFDVYQDASSLGDTGAASPYFGLTAAWADGVEDVVVVGYGDGAVADAVEIAGTAPVSEPRETVDLAYSEYLRMRGEIVTTGGGK